MLTRCTLLAELLIHSYFNIVKREMIDMVPKAITLKLVAHSKDNLQRELLQELYKPEVLNELLKESEYIVNRRKEVIGMVQALNKAEECVHDLVCGQRFADRSFFPQDCVRRVDGGPWYRLYLPHFLVVIVIPFWMHAFCFQPSRVGRPLEGG